MKGTTRRKLSNALIAVGAALIVVGAGYEAINYPWSILLAKLGIAQEQTLPDPKPLPLKALMEGVGGSGGDETGDALPANGTYVAARPEMDIDLLGTIKLPKLGVSENIVEGTKDELLYGVGHVRGTANIGQRGNCVLAGHRNYIVMHPFRHLDKIAVGDRITVEDGSAVYTYEAFSIFTIEPDDVWILHPQEDEEYLLTLLTCTPVINPTHRLIVWCKLVETVAKPLV